MTSAPRQRNGRERETVSGNVSTLRWKGENGNSLGSVGGKPWRGRCTRRSTNPLISEFFPAYACSIAKQKLQVVKRSVKSYP